MGIFTGFLRTIFGHFDYVIYSLIKWITQGIFDIAFLRTDVSLVETIRNRLYVILGVFMLFKLSISFIGYIINPESMFSEKDKNKNLGGIISRTIVMLVLLILLPSIFSVLYRAQSAFLPVIPRLFFNTSETVTVAPSQEEVSDQAAESANEMAIMLLRAFYAPYYDEDNNYAAIGGVTDINDLEEFRSTLTEKVNGEYKYDYKFPISTVVAIVVIYIILKITITIATRTFKMLALEMIAPIPVMSYIDPKSSKDGAFAGWLKELSTTFLSLFLNLGLVYVMLFFIRELQNDNLFASYGAAEGTGVNPVRKAYLIVFLILGILKFAKEAPEFFKSIFGIKGSKAGDGFSKSMGGISGAITGGVAGAAGGLVTGRGLSGAITGAATGANASREAALQGKSINSYKAGADAAIKARTGDKDRVSGFPAAIQRRAEKSQYNREAAKFGITENSIDIAKSDMIAKQGLATDAEHMYREIINQEAQYTEADKVAGAPRYADYHAYETRKTTAYSDWQTKAAAADKAERTFSKGKELAKVYRVGKSDPETYKEKMSPTGRAKTKVKQTAETAYDNVATRAGGQTISQRRDARTTKIADKGGYNPDDR